MHLNLVDWLRLTHPALTMLWVYPILGLVLSRSWLTRQRRLASAEVRKSIPANVGTEHKSAGQWLAIAVIGAYLIGCGRPTINFWLKTNALTQLPVPTLLITLTYGVAVGCTWAIFQSIPRRLWRFGFAGMNAIALIVIGFQQGVYRNDAFWYQSHFYFGLAVTLMMVFSLATFPEVLSDRTQRWRSVHIAVNILATLFFAIQILTGTRDLLEIPLSWQEKTIYSCNYEQSSPAYKTCPELQKTNQP
jgi:Protein of unknown function (DUF4079)